ncbi:hypothetical protein AJ87_40190 [Rhizobium yanglingense]|nr:hypothetical protein AJ87_40190 [Rhizobium yanglingense]
MLATIDEIQTMTEATLAFARGEATVEETRTIELNALVGSLCDDLAELGQNVEFSEGAKINYRCRPEGLRRAIRNLVENAVRYGGEARVHLFHTPTTIDIVVEDDGPGIPENATEQVFAPFFRLESRAAARLAASGWGFRSLEPSSATTVEISYFPRIGRRRSGRGCGRLSLCPR